MKKVKVILFVIVLVCLNACIGGGTHGYIKRYRYNTSKSILEKTVHQVLLNNSIVIQDSVKGYYNDDTNYVSIKINEKGLQFAYTFHFYGGKEYWDTSHTSAISISYAYDDKRNGGSAGNGGVKRGNNKLRKRLLEPFEREFISKIDSMLGMQHTEE